MPRDELTPPFIRCLSLFFLQFYFNVACKVWKFIEYILKAVIKTLLKKKVKKFFELLLQRIELLELLPTLLLLHIFALVSEDEEFMQAMLILQQFYDEALAEVESEILKLGDVLF